MANTTIRGAKAIHGANPITLIETVIRLRIWESSFWKEECFALTAVSLIDKAIKLNTIGGVYDNTKPTQFICLLLKLLQIQPEKEIIVEYLLVEEYKYLRALAAIYIRLTFGAVEVYELLEPLLNDYSKLRQLSISGYSLTYMDEFVDKLLNEDRVCDIILPRLPKRAILEETEGLAPRKSKLMDAMEDKESVSSRHRGRSRSRSRSGSMRASDSRSRSRSRSPSLIASNDEEDRYISRSPSRSRSRSRSGSPNQMDTTV
ncbi:PRP38-domain-containing protein [Serendipita vermifera]|nr:PRP38-domain-containing protein [Serendipita vermifera]